MLEYIKNILLDSEIVIVESKYTFHDKYILPKLYVLYEIITRIAGEKKRPKK